MAKKIVTSNKIVRKSSKSSSPLDVSKKVIKPTTKRVGGRTFSSVAPIQTPQGEFTLSKRDQKRILGRKSVYARQKARDKAWEKGEDTYETDDGTRLYDTKTRKLLAKRQPTTLSNINKIEEVPKMTKRLDTLSNKGIVTDTEGNQRYADGSFITEDWQPTERAQREQKDEYESVLEEMRKSLDAETQAQIRNVQQKFSQRKLQQEKINKAQEAQMQNALLMGGVSGAGSSAQYAPISSQGIMMAQESYGVSKLAELDSEEQDLIAQARQAQSEGNFQILEKKLALAEEKRKEKLDAAAELNKQVAEQNKKLEERQQIIDRENAISDLFAQGVTDPQSIMTQLRGTGLESTAKEVNDTVSLLSGIGGTGIVGEYNFYAAQARSKGQVPMDFIAYQNEDANRKKSIAKAGVSTGTSGLTYNTAQEKVITRVDKDVSNNPSYKRTASMQTFADNVDVALSQGTGVGDIAAINQFQKVIDEGAVTRDQDVRLIQGAQSVANRLKTKLKRLEKGEQLSPDTRAEIRKTVDDILIAQRKAIANDPFIKAKKKELERNGVDPMDTIFGELEGYSSQTGDDNSLIDKGEEAKSTIDKFITENDDESTNEMIYKFYDKGMSDIAIYEYLQARGLLK